MECSTKPLRNVFGCTESVEVLLYIMLELIWNWLMGSRFLLIEMKFCDSQRLYTFL